MIFPMSRILILILFTILNLDGHAAANSDDHNEYLGEYSSNTEADCEITVALRESGVGEAVRICSSEKADNQSSTHKMPFRWEVKDSKIYIHYLKYLTKLQYESNLLCDKNNGAAYSKGLVLKSKGQNIFLGGYGGRFWKKDGGCIK